MDKILKVFFEHPEKEFHVRELSKLLKKSPTTISKYLKEFEKEKILQSNEKLNHLLFRANIENKKFKQLKANYNLNVLENLGLIEHLVKEFNYPEAIVLFGSFSNGEDSQKSDIDLLIISPLKKEIDLTKFENGLNRKIQIFVRSKEDIKNMKIKNKELLNSIVNGIVVHGFWELFK
ncbi:MAG: nucleotidyltransferase domain-containing protein [Nanoarchaeota archaeon]|nr:nucleotidyltransferase domain-containing protein [Nanoarchaeota archaeon]